MVSVFLCYSTMKTYLRKYPRDAGLILVFVFFAVLSADSLSTTKQIVLFLAGFSWAAGYYLLGKSWEPPGNVSLRVVSFVTIFFGSAFFMWLFTLID